MSTENNKWYVANTGNHQGLVVEEATGKNIAVAYDKGDAPLLAAAPELLEALRELVGIICESGRDVTLEDCDHAKGLIAKATNPQAT